MSDSKSSPPPPRDTAPDLEILADQVTLRPSGYVEPLPKKTRAGAGEGEQNLVEHMAKFRSSPLEYAPTKLSTSPPIPDLYCVLAELVLEEEIMWVKVMTDNIIDSSAKSPSTSQAQDGAPTTTS